MNKPLAVAIAAALLAAGGTPARAGNPQEEAQKLIKKLANDKDPEMRSMAAGRLGTMKAVEAVPALATALKDKDSSVRANAAGATPPARGGREGRHARAAGRAARQRQHRSGMPRAR